MKSEAKNADLALYCKQRSIESWAERAVSPWACGYSSLITAMRLLGDREIQADALPRRLNRTGQNPRDGIDDDQLRYLAGHFGYSIRSFPARSRYYRDEFVEWLRGAWGRQHPTVVAVNDGMHFICAYSNPDDSAVWIMDPLEEDQVFEALTLNAFLDWSSDNSEDYVSWGAHEIIPPREMANANRLPPSVALFEWVNDLPGSVEDSDFVAAAFVDNAHEIVRKAQVGSGRNGLAFEKITADDGPLWSTIEEWDSYYDEDDLAVLAEMLEVLQDIYAYRDVKIDARKRDLLVGELALLFTHTLMLHNAL